MLISTKNAIFSTLSNLLIFHIQMISMVVLDSPIQDLSEYETILTIPGCLLSKILAQKWSIEILWINNNQIKLQLS